MKLKWSMMRSTADMASCREVARVMHAYLDRELDEHTAKRVGKHLEVCRRCGLEVATYTEIKRALERQTSPVDPAALDRLRAFGDSLAAGDPPRGASAGDADG